MALAAASNRLLGEVIVERWGKPPEVSNRCPYFSGRVDPRSCDTRGRFQKTIQAIKLQAELPSEVLGAPAIRRLGGVRIRMPTALVFKLFIP